MTEIFKDIKGYEGMYQVSNFGNIKSVSRFNSKTEKFLKFDINKKTHTNYLRATLSKDNKIKKFQVHRLVAEAFIDNPDNKQFVNHIDNNGENNTVANLEWCSHSENMKHSQKQGRLFKTQSIAGKVSAKTKREIKLKELNSLIGNKFNSWTLLEPLPRNGNWYGIFKCDCGNIKEVNISTVFTNKSKHCSSCGHKQSHINRKEIKI